MTPFEYKTVALPAVMAVRRKRRQTEADLIAERLGASIAEEAVDGWEYYRSETLSTPERKGMFGKSAATTYTVLIFRRAPEAAWRRPADTRKMPVEDAEASPTQEVAEQVVAKPPPKAAPAPQPLREAPRPTVRNVVVAIPAAKKAAPKPSAPNLRLATPEEKKPDAKPPEAKAPQLATLAGRGEAGKDDVKTAPTLGSAKD